MPAHTSTKNPAVLSHHAMRRLVGIIALLLPFVLAGGTILLALIGPSHAVPHPLLQRSISDYRYTAMGDCYVGALCAIAAFLMCTRGYDWTDEITGYLAGALALGVALCPSVNPRDPVHSPLQLELNTVHTMFAAQMFLVLAYFCLVLFRRSSPGKSRTRRKQHRNAVYAVCGAVILVCDAMMVSLNLEGAARILRPFNPLLNCESLALIAFGVAWLTKGNGILRDRPHNHVQPL
ncbi:MAG: DUF998 domain-containing protein [Terracidiphilus sp.]